MKIQKKIHLARLSSFGIGGIAKEFIKVTNVDEFLEVLKWAYKKRKKFIVFAGGSNVVFPDEETGCLVIHVVGGKVTVQDETFLVDGGVMLKDVIDKSIISGLSGLEQLSGIPGTVGGAIVGNAGAYGHSISEVIENVRVFDGERDYWINNKDCKFRYRDSIFKHKILFLLQTRLRFQKRNKEELLKTSKEIITLREQKYKPGIKCPGSFFKNVLVSNLTSDQLATIEPKWIKYGKIPAGYLLEAIGAKGLKHGDIEVAEYHGNLLLNNSGNGTAKDVKELARMLKEKVRERFGIELEEEVRYF